MSREDIETMKKVLFYTLFCLLLTACSKHESRTVDNLTEGHYVYPVDNYSSYFDVTEDGVLYYSQFEETEDMVDYLGEDGEMVQSYGRKLMIHGMDLEGNIIETIDMANKWFSDFLYMKGKIYYYNINSVECDHDVAAGEHDHGSSVTFYEYTIETKETKTLLQKDHITSIKEMRIVRDKLYYLAQDDTLLGKVYALANNEIYVYGGEVLGMYDLATAKVYDLPIDFPVYFAATLDHNIMVYAHDSHRGYYFQEYNTTNGELADKIYKDLGGINQFSIFNQKNEIIYTYSGSSMNIAVSTLKEDSPIRDIIPYAYGAQYITSKEYIYFSNGMRGNRIERITPAAYVRTGATIRMISNTNLYYTPFGCGYSIIKEYPDEQSFALSVLSQDRDYDMFLMSSRDSVSENIRDKGTFYPLNAVPGVEKYINQCFPYLQDAATNEDGDIWMIPIAVDVPVVIYNELQCKEYGLDFTQALGIEEFASALAKLRSNKDVEHLFNISSYIIAENEFHQYLQESKQLDEEEYERVALLLKESFNYLRDTSIAQRATAVNELLNNGTIDKLLFNVDYYYDSQVRLTGNSSLRASRLPTMNQNDSSVATCLYLSVNPASKNLSSALDYISSLCDYIPQLSNHMLFKDRNRYSQSQFNDDLYEIYQNSEVVFTLPTDLYWSDFNRYLQDEIEVEEFVKESSRKIDIYLKE